ncbi:MAG: hypothetical protein ACI9C1_001559 [Candidatus Aldehydirespiratoraceae bacterium]|jgi:hypothetical protein
MEFTARGVPADPARYVTVTFRVDNQTVSTQEYEVRSAIKDGPECTGNVVASKSGESLIGSTTGGAMEDSCRPRFEIDMSVVHNSEDHFPLAVFVSDSTIRC